MRARARAIRSCSIVNDATGGPRLPSRRHPQRGRSSMTGRRAGRVRIATAVALLTIAAAAGPAVAAAPAPDAAQTPTPSGSYRRSGRALDAASAQAGLQSINVEYHGGPVISNVRVHSVYWGAGSYQQGTGPNENRMIGFFGGVTASSYMDWMTEYNTPTQAIGRGTYHGQTTIAPSTLNNAITIDDSNIRPELVAQLQAGALPAPELDAAGNVNTLYALFFPQGKVITDGTAVGGQAGGFCAYHGTVSFNGLIVPYMVLPDFDDPVAHYDDGCGGAPALFDNFTSVTAHEL